MVTRTRPEQRHGEAWNDRRALLAEGPRTRASRLVGRLRSSSRRHWAWRAALASPFALSVILGVAVGPGSIDHRYGSFVWLTAVAVGCALAMLALSDTLLVPVGLVAFLVFPPMAGLGFYFAPGWAQPEVAAVFYGSILASLAAVITGIATIIRRIVRRARRPVLIAAVSVVTLLVGWLALPGGSSPRPSVAAASSRALETYAVNMGPVINSSHREAEPSFTADGRALYFNCRDLEICVTHLRGTWGGGRWTAPQVVGAPVSTSYVEVEPLISPEGNKLYITSSRPFGSGEGVPGLSFYIDALYLLNTGLLDRLGLSLFGGLGQEDVWVSHLVGGAWSVPRSLNDVPGEPPINGNFNDHCLFISADGNEAFWTSDRPGGSGGNDIWTMRQIDGQWTPPSNLGPSVNSPQGDHHAMLSPDGRSLYITSDRPGGYGGEDIYTTTRDAGGRWAPLVNVGPPLNGPGNDRCPVLTPDRRLILFDSDRVGGFGSKDIWWISNSGGI